ncbi:DUF3566 domain-containing protein [Nocardioidaceae bacterium]|nr:DUF3566 domain-containing protein [Nocardioidaceae bacterium]
MADSSTSKSRPTRRDAEEVRVPSRESWDPTAGDAAPGTTSSGSSSSSGGASSSGRSFADKVRSALRDAGRNLDDARTAPAGGAAPSKATTNKRPTRRARLRLTRLDPWSVAKTAFLLSIALGVMTVVAVALVWGVLDAAGVWDSINAMVYQVIGSESSTDFDVENYLGTSRIVGFTLIVAGINVVLLTAIATLAAFLYNLGAALLGGIEVTLAEDAR